MPNKMLIDASHPEETRVVVVRGQKVEEFDFESANRKQLRGNIYLAKVTRVEPSLQAAFVEYGGNRHGFLAFSEIHPDYYQIPVADRQRLLDLQAEQARLEDEEDDLELALSQTPAEPPAAVDPAAQPAAEPWASADQPRLIAFDEAAAPAAIENPAAEDAGAADAGAKIPDADDRFAVDRPVEPADAEPWAMAALPALTAPRPAVAAR